MLKRLALLSLLLLPVALLLSRAMAEALVVVVALSFVVHCIRSRTQPWQRLDFALLALTWLLLNLLVSPLAADSGASFGRSLPWLRFVLLYGAATQWLLQEAADRHRASLALGAVLLLTAADCLVQLITGTSLSGQPMLFGRLTGPLDRPNIGIFLAKIGLPVCAGLVAAALARVRGARALLLTLAVALPAVIALTGERSSLLLSLMALTLVICAAASVSRRPLLTLLVPLGVLGAGVSLAVAFSERLAYRARQLVTDLSGFADTQYGMLFESGWRMFLDAPLTGVGMRGFRDVCPALLADGRARYCDLHPHNIYLEWLAETGLAGLLAFAAFLAVVLMRTLRGLGSPGAARIAAACAAGALLVGFFPISATQSFFSNWPALLAWLSLSLLVALGPAAQDRAARP